MIVSFDFDTTLKTCMGKPNTEIVKEFRSHNDAGDTIIIVTSRFPVCGSTREILLFLHENHLIDGMPPKIYYTCGELKAATLVELGVEKHFDDCQEELRALPPQIIGVNAWNKQAELDFNQFYE